MPSSVRPTKSYSGGSRTLPVTPMSERQQLALLMQMTSSSNDSGSRSPSTVTNFRSRDRNERGETPLHLAAIKGDVEQVCKLLAHRADPNVADFAGGQLYTVCQQEYQLFFAVGWTPLHEACNHGWYEVAFRLVQAGANVNAKGLDNETPLHDAAVNGHLKLVKLLVEKGADIYAKNSKGKTPVDIAAPGVTPILMNPSLPISGKIVLICLLKGFILLYIYCSLSIILERIDKIYIIKYFIFSNQSLLNQNIVIMYNNRLCIMCTEIKFGAFFVAPSSQNYS